MTDDLGDTLQPRRKRSFFPAAEVLGSNPAFQAMNRPMSQYGSPAGKRLSKNDLVTYTLPSGAQVTVKKGGKLPSGYAQAEGQPAGNITSPESRAAVANAPIYMGGAADYAKGFGAVDRPVLPDFSGYAPPIQQPMTPVQFGARALGNIVSAPLRYASRGIMGGFGLAYNAINGLRNQQPNQNVQRQNFYAYNPSPIPMQPTRYFDNF